MTNDQVQAKLDQLGALQTELEAAVAAGPAGSLRREALAMATGWLVYVKASLETALAKEA